VAIVCTLIQIYVWVVVARIILEWIPVPADHVVGQFRRLLSRAVDPVLEPMRRFIPPLRTGTMALDLSPIILILVLNFVILPIIC
jgi:YggT family protein